MKRVDHKGHWHCPSCGGCTEWGDRSVIAVIPTGYQTVCKDCARDD